MPRSRRDAAAWGVVLSHTDTARRRHRPRRATVEAMLDALGADAPRPDAPPAVILAPGAGARLAAPCEPILEDGTRLAATNRLGGDLPLGIHLLQPLDGSAARPLIVAPRRCHLPTRLRAGGLAVQLYAARSRDSWGIGDLADLRTLGAWAASRGARLCLVNPLHAPLPTLPQQPSPYTPSSRRFRTPLALRLEECDGWDDGDPALSRLAAEARALNRERHIDRDAVHRCKLTALERLHGRFGGSPAFDGFRREAGEALHLFAVHAAISEVHGASWRRWPEELRRPRTAAVERFAAERHRRVSLHAWVQWQIDLQLAAAGAVIPLMQDLAVGVDPDGADAWVDHDVLADGARIGAPPDDFNVLGQDWGLPPFDPWRLRAASYRPLVAALRAGMRHSAALRLDHVMGLTRLWWIPPGAGPTEGAYVRYPAEELFAVLALESARAAALVVGEDLGTVPRGLRATMAAHGVLSYRLLWFEDRPPARYPRRAMAALTTHDLPTVAGLWTGSDVEAQEAAGLHPDRHAVEAVLARALAVGVPRRAGPDQAAEILHAVLAAAPSMLVTATLDDLARVAERPNLPGTVDEWPNWRLALPRPIEEVTADPWANRVLATVARRGR